MATGSEMTDGDIIIRYDGDEITSNALLHAEALPPLGLPETEAS